MQTTAVVMERPGRAELRRLPLDPRGPADVVVDIAWSGISTGTERLLWSGRMPPFPGMGYPLVPGYESVGTVVEAGRESGRRAGQTVFVPGARCFGAVRGLFGGAASRVVLPGSRTVPVDPGVGETGTLLALAATAHHVLAGHAAPELIVGHGALGRLLARVAVALGHPPPTVWDKGATRRAGQHPYPVLAPFADPRRDYAVVVDASGSMDVLDTLVDRLAPGGELVLAGFYPGRVGFAFAPAFRRELRLRCPAEFRPEDLLAVRALLDDGRLALDGLVTHRSPAGGAGEAYRVAFDNPLCLKMVLDWRSTP